MAPYVASTLLEKKRLNDARRKVTPKLTAKALETAQVLMTSAALKTYIATVQT